MPLLDSVWLAVCVLRERLWIQVCAVWFHHLPVVWLLDPP